MPACASHVWLRAHLAPLLALVPSVPIASTGVVYPKISKSPAKAERLVGSDTSYASTNPMLYPSPAGAFGLHPTWSASLYPSATF